MQQEQKYPVKVISYFGKTGKLNKPTPSPQQIDMWPKATGIQQEKVQEKDNILGSMS